MASNRIGDLRQLASARVRLVRMVILLGRLSMTVVRGEDVHFIFHFLIIIVQLFKH